MSVNDARSATPALAEGSEMVAKMRSGVFAALAEHKRCGRSIVTYDSATGQIREIPPVEILVEAAPEPSTATNSIH